MIAPFTHTCQPISAPKPVFSPHVWQETSFLHEYTHISKRMRGNNAAAQICSSSLLLCRVNVSHLDLAVHENSNDGQARQAKPCGASCHFVAITVNS